MKRLVKTLFVFSVVLIVHWLCPTSAAAQTRQRIVNQPDIESFKVDVDLVVMDALVMQKKTGRVVGQLSQDSFTVFEDGVKQQITHFSQSDSPLSVLLLVDRGGCLDPFGGEVRQAVDKALARLKPTDEVALMTFHNTVELMQGFSYDRTRIAEAMRHVPEHEEDADHCLNRALYEAAEFMHTANNPAGRRVIIVVTGLTSFFDCGGGPAGKEVRHAVFESGSVVNGLIPSSPAQRLESGALRVATGIAGMFKAPSLNLNELADETGGEVVDDKPEALDRAFNSLIDHLRTRYYIGFVPSNKKRDGSFRKLKLDVASAVQKREGPLVIKTKRGYVAPKK